MPCRARLVEHCSWISGASPAGKRFQNAPEIPLEIGTAVRRPHDMDHVLEIFLEIQKMTTFGFGSHGNLWDIHIVKGPHLKLMRKVKEGKTLLLHCYL